MRGGGDGRGRREDARREMDDLDDEKLGEMHMAVMRPRVRQRVFMEGAV